MDRLWRCTGRYAETRRALSIVQQMDHAVRPSEQAFAAVSIAAGELNDCGKRPARCSGRERAGY